MILSLVNVNWPKKTLKSQKSQRIIIEGSAAAHNYCHPKSKVVSGLERGQKNKKEKAKGDIEDSKAWFGIIVTF